VEFKGLYAEGYISIFLNFHSELNLKQSGKYMHRIPIVSPKCGNCVQNCILWFRPQKKMFPVKLTDPVTAILYVTYDKQHMEELRHTIHLKEIVEGKNI
jgi:hypothetical protein